MGAHGYFSINKDKIKHMSVYKNAEYLKFRNGWVYKNGAYLHVWSGASLVSYYDNTTLINTEEVDEGEDVLHPSFDTTKEGYTLVGWSTAPNDLNKRVTTLVATGEDMALYALYLPNVLTAYQGSRSGATISNSQYIGGTCYGVHGRAGYIVGTGTDTKNYGFTVYMGMYNTCVINAQGTEGGYGSGAWARVEYDGTNITDSTITRTYNGNAQHSHSWKTTCHTDNGPYYAEVTFWLNSVTLSNPTPWT